MSKLTRPDGRSLLPVDAVSNLGVCFDAVQGGAWKWTDKGLEVRIRPFWFGVRKYPATDGTQVRVLRRRSQVMAQAHLQRFARLTITDGHPRIRLQNGELRKVFLSAKAEPGSPTPFDPNGTVWMPHEAFYVGSFGDSWAEVDSPLGRTAEFVATITVRSTADKARAGDFEVSTGHLMHYLPATESEIDGEEVVGLGQWKNPVTGQIEEYDVEGLSNPEDPRVPAKLREHLGPNHNAATVGAGRGGPGVRLLPLLPAGEGVPRVALDQAELAAGLRLIAMTRPAESPDPCALIIATGGEEDMATMIWLGTTPSASTYGRFADLMKRHVDDHPERETILTGLAVAPDTGQGLEVDRPSADQVPPVEPDPPTDTTRQDMADTPDYQKMYQELLAASQQKDQQIQQLSTENAALKQKVAETEAASGDAKKEATQAQTAATEAKTAADKAKEDAKTANDQAAAAKAAFDALDLEMRPVREQQLEQTRQTALELAAGSDKVEAIKAVKVTVEKPFSVALDELHDLGLTGHFAQHPSNAPADPTSLKDAGYRRYRFADLGKQLKQPTPRGSTFDSLRPEPKPAGTANDATDKPDDDDLMGRLRSTANGK